MQPLMLRWSTSRARSTCVKKLHQGKRHRCECVCEKGKFANPPSLSLPLPLSLPSPNTPPAWQKHTHTHTHTYCDAISYHVAEEDTLPCHAPTCGQLLDPRQGIPHPSARVWKKDLLTYTRLHVLPCFKSQCLKSSSSVGLCLCVFLWSDPLSAQHPAVSVHSPRCLQRQ